MMAGSRLVQLASWKPMEGRHPEKWLYAGLVHAPVLEQVGVEERS
jgi:hypothetical protein